MRGARSLVVTFVALVCIASPLAAALAPRAVDRPDSTPQDLLRFFAGIDAIDTPRVSAPVAWSDAMLGLYSAAGLTATPDALAVLRAQDRELDPRLQAWVAPLVQATAEATVLSLAGDHAEAAILLLDAVDTARPASTPPDPTCLKTADPNDPAGALAWTIRTSLSAIDECETPHRDPLPVPAAAWPATPVADPLGLVEIGSLGNDVYLDDRRLQIEPGGDDEWRNNAGGAFVESGVDLSPPGFEPVLGAVALGWDMGGNDLYYTLREGGQGSGIFGVGILLEDAGDDSYSCGLSCQGSAVAGVGVLHDQDGSDDYYVRIRGQAYAGNHGIALALEDSGNDAYYAGSGQAYVSAADAYLRDLDGIDVYTAGTTNGIMGRSFDGRAYFRDFGGDTDSYAYVGQNNHIWTNGLGPDVMPPEFIASEGWDR